MRTKFIAAIASGAALGALALAGTSAADDGPFSPPTVPVMTTGVTVTNTPDSVTLPTVDTGDPHAAKVTHKAAPPCGFTAATQCNY